VSALLPYPKILKRILHLMKIGISCDFVSFVVSDQRWFTQIFADFMKTQIRQIDPVEIKLGCLMRINEQILLE